MTVSKYWGDEKLADAIFAVYLKKVRYVPPSEYEGLPHYRPIDPDNHHLAEDLTDGSDHLQWETIRERVIKAGTLDRIVESLVGGDDRMDSRQFNVFFATFRAFAEPSAVLEKFTAWFEKAMSDGKQNGIDPPTKHSSQALQSTIRSILICWLDMYPEDFFQPDDNFSLLNRLIDFSRSRNLYDLKYKARKVKERYRKVAVEGGLASQIPSISRYCYTTGFDPNNYEYAQQRAQMFHVGKENVVQIAEQLTFWDAVLFRELRPYQCTGAIWGRRYKKSSEAVYSVRATIDQFNAVSQRVMTSIVFPDCSREFRAKIIEKWIEVTRELRALKNFSSLKAVLGSLQAEPVHRLKSVWALVSKVSMAQFKDLSAIFETDENGDEQKARNILDAEGTAKSSPLKRPQLIQNCRRTKSDVNLAESQGTVPFLGTFLTDLTMLDQAHYDLTPEGLLNFEKRRKEFEVLAKIRLFQSAARAYTIPMDQAFCVWFYYLPALNENECFNKSLEVESSSLSTPDIKRKQPKVSNANGFYAPTMPIAKIQSLTKMFTSFGTSEESPLAGQHSNDSGIHTEESWTASSEAGTPNHEAMFSTTLSRAKGIMNGSGSTWGSQKDRSSTAPSTPVGTLSLRGVPNYSGSEFNPQLHFSPSRTISRDNSPCINGRVSSSSVIRPDDLPDGYSQPRPSSKNYLQSENGKSNPFASSSRSATPQTMSADVMGPSPRHYLLNKMNGHHQSSQKSNSSSSSRSSYNSSICASPATNAAVGGVENISKAQEGFHLARVGLDDEVEETTVSNTNYKCIKVVNGDKMVNLINRALEKHMIDEKQVGNYCLVQLLPDGSELKLPDNCNPFYAVAPDPTSPMLNFLLKKRTGVTQLPTSAKKLNKQKRSNLLRWSSGYL